MKGEEETDVSLPERYILTIARNNLYHGLDKLIHVFAMMAKSHPNLYLIIGTYGKTTDRKDAILKEQLAGSPRATIWRSASCSPPDYGP